MNYEELVKALRCKRDDCEGCDLAFFDKDEGWMCRYSAKGDDAADAIEELQAEVERLQAQLPKRGKWIWIQKANGGQYKGCSVCHAPIPTDSMLDYLDDEDCDFCYSCGAKMEVQE